MAHRCVPLVQSRTCQWEPFANREPVRDDIRVKISVVFVMLLIKRKPEESTPWQFPGTWLRSRRDSPGLQNRCPWRNGLLAVIRYQLLPCSDINKAITNLTNV
jgi:hypothetical protein